MIHFSWLFHQEQPGQELLTARLCFCLLCHKLRSDWWQDPHKNHLTLTLCRPYNSHRNDLTHKPIPDSVLSSGRTSSWTWDKVWLSSLPGIAATTATLREAGHTHISLGFSSESYWTSQKGQKELTTAPSTAQPGSGQIRLLNADVFISVRPTQAQTWLNFMVKASPQQNDAQVQVFPSCHPLQGDVQRLSALRLASEGQQSSEHTSGVCLQCTGIIMYSLFFGFWGGYDSTWRRYSSVYLTIRNTF